MVEAIKNLCAISLLTRSEDYLEFNLRKFQTLHCQQLETKTTAVPAAPALETKTTAVPAAPAQETIPPVLEDTIQDEVADEEL